MSSPANETAPSTSASGSIRPPRRGNSPWQADYAVFQDWFDAQGFWAILAIGVAPIPFQIAMLVAGVAGYPLFLFILAAGIARGIRYYGLALLVRAFGERALALWQRHKLTVGILLLALVAVTLAFNVFLVR